MGELRHAFECWVPRDGVCRDQCSCSCHFDKEPWRHVYETDFQDFCIHCGQVGSYIHTNPKDRGNTPVDALD